MAARAGATRILDWPSIRVAIYEPSQAAHYAKLIAAAGCTAQLTPCASPQELEAVIAETDILVGVGKDLPPSLWAKASRLQYIQGLWAGVERWHEAQVPRELPIVRMTGIFGAPISEFVFGHLLANHVLDAARLRTQQAAHVWEQFEPGALSGRVMGVLGVGDIGSAVAKRARAFEMTVWGMGRTARADPPAHFDRYFTAEPASMSEFLRAVDYLVLIVPKTDDSKHVIGAAELAAMKPGAVVINVGRGHSLDEEALVASLKSGHTGGAILDVFHTEPLPASNPLWDAPRTVIAPHISGPTRPEPAAHMVWRNMQIWARGEVPPGVVDRDAGY